MNYRYLIKPRAAQLGGFKLECFENENDTEIEVLGGVFETEIEAENEALEWLNSRPLSPLFES